MTGFGSTGEGNRLCPSAVESYEIRIKGRLSDSLLAALETAETRRLVCAGLAAARLTA